MLPQSIVYYLQRGNTAHAYSIGEGAVGEDLNSLYSVLGLLDPQYELVEKVSLTG